MRESGSLRSYALIAVLIVAAGLVIWSALAVLPRSPARSAADERASTSGAQTGISARPTPTDVPPAVTARPATAPLGGTAASASEELVDTTPEDRRQVGKITRGLRVNPAGGLYVDATPPGSVVGQLHLQVGDVIVSVNGAPMSSPEEFARLYRGQGLPRELTVIRNGREIHRH